VKEAWSGALDVPLTIEWMTPMLSEKRMEEFPAIRFGKFLKINKIAKSSPIEI